jgi:hypothetical protein
MGPPKFAVKCRSLYCGLIAGRPVNENGDESSAELRLSSATPPL